MNEDLELLLYDVSIGPRLVPVRQSSGFHSHCDPCDVASFVCVLSMTLTGSRGRNCCLNEWSSRLVVAWGLPCLVIHTNEGSGEDKRGTSGRGYSVRPLLPSFNKAVKHDLGQRNSILRSGKKSGWQWDAAVNGILLSSGWLKTHQGDILWPKTKL